MMQLRVENTSGCQTLGGLDFQAYFEGLRDAYPLNYEMPNVVVKIEPQAPSRHTLLISICPDQADEAIEGPQLGRLSPEERQKWLDMDGGFTDFVFSVLIEEQALGKVTAAAEMAHAPGSAGRGNRPRVIHLQP